VGEPASVAAMNEGLPIAYEVLDTGVPVYASDGSQVGTVEDVVAASGGHIFDGIVLGTDAGRRLGPADQVASLHERGGGRGIDAAAVASLEEPHGGAPAWRDQEPGVKPSAWKRLVDLVTGKDPGGHGREADGGHWDRRVVQDDHQNSGGEHRSDSEAERGSLRRGGVLNPDPQRPVLATANNGSGDDQ